jgi:hypothetical protein
MNMTGDGRWTWFEAEEELPAPNYKLKMIFCEATPIGMSFVLDNTSESSEFRYLQRYSLYMWKNDEWEPMIPISWCYDDTIHTILPLSRSDLITADWEFIFGELPAGRYKFKDHAFGYGSQEHPIEQEFTLE